MKKKQISKKEEEDFSDEDEDQSNSEANSEGSQEEEDENSNSEEEKYSSDEEEDEILGVEPNEAMLAWANLFKDEAKLTELSEKIWGQSGFSQRKVPINDANRARIELNKELLKYVKEKQSIVEDEDPQKFPIEKFGIHFTKMNKAGFVEKAHELNKMAEILEILGSKLMPAIYSVYEEKYKEKDGTWGKSKVYLEFFRDVAEKMNVNEENVFDQLDEAMQVCEKKKGKTKFDFDTCFRLAKSNFESLYSQTSLYRDSNMILKYTV